MYKELIVVANIKHMYPFTFVNHEETRNFIKFFNVEVPYISRNTLKLDVIKFITRKKRN